MTRGGGALHRARWGSPSPVQGGNWAASTRVGGGSALHEAPDPRQLRSPGELYADPRARFKDSYVGPVHLHDGRGGARHAGVVAGEEHSHEDAAAARNEQQLLIELRDARAEILQLRSAVKACADALQQAIELAPPEARGKFDQKQDTLMSLVEEVKGRDEEILRLRKEVADDQEAVSASKAALFSALEKWAPGGVQHFLQRVLAAWRSGGHELRQERMFRDGLAKGHAMLQPKLVKVIGGLTRDAGESQARTIVVAWASAVAEMRQEKERASIMRKKAEKTMLAWEGSSKHTRQAAVFSAWRRLMQAKREESHMEDLRRELLQEQKESRFLAIRRAVVAFGAGDGADPNAIRVMLQSWRSMALEAHAEKVLKQEQERGQKSAKRAKEAAQRRALLLMGDTGKLVLATSFATWRDDWEAAREKARHEKAAFTRQVFNGWRTATKAGRRERELQAQRKELEARERAYKDKLRRSEKQRGVLMGLADMNAHGKEEVGKQIVWSAWRDVWADAKRAREMEEQRKRWKEEWQQRFEEQNNKALHHKFLSAFMPVESQAQEMLLRTAWFALVELVEHAKRDRELSGDQRLLEEQLDQAQREAERLQQQASQLQKEASLMENKHKDEHRRRRAALALTSSVKASVMKSGEKLMLMRLCWSAWRECWQDAKLDAKRLDISKHREALERIKLHAALDPARAEPRPPEAPSASPSPPSPLRRRWWCCCQGTSRRPPKPGPARPGLPGAAAPLKDKAGWHGCWPCCRRRARTGKVAEGAPQGGGRRGAFAGPRATPDAGGAPDPEVGHGPQHPPGQPQGSVPRPAPSTVRRAELPAVPEEDEEADPQEPRRRQSYDTSETDRTPEDNDRSTEGDDDTS